MSISPDYVKPAALSEVQPIVPKTDHEIMSPTHQTDKLIEKADRKINEIGDEPRESFLASSHDLAHHDCEIKGEAQKRPILEPGTEVRDLGWHKDISNEHNTLIGGVRNKRLFAMVRRFNKVRTWDIAHPLQSPSTN
jgi:hypothetical protein